jgi:hypothetical protein
MAEEAAMAEKDDEAERRADEQEVRNREFARQVVDQVRIVADANRAILHVVLPDDPGRDATAVADALDSLHVALTQLQESLAD